MILYIMMILHCQHKNMVRVTMMMKVIAIVKTQIAMDVSTQIGAP